MYQARNNAKTTKSPRRLLPAFKRVARAETYAPACAAAYRLAGELLALGQSPAVIAADLAALNGAGLPTLLLAEIVQAARDRAVHTQEGGAA